MKRITPGLQRETTRAWQLFTLLVQFSISENQSAIRQSTDPYPSMSSAGEAFTIFVKEAGRKQSLHLELRAGADVQEMKQSLQQQHGFQPEKFFLIFSGKRLHLDQRLADCGINAGTTVNFMIGTWPQESQPSGSAAAASSEESNDSHQLLAASSETTATAPSSKPAAPPSASDRGCCAVS